jgi:uncharacterized SAM-binding protein YcdF (DUF218 family)
MSEEDVGDVGDASASAMAQSTTPPRRRSRRVVLVVVAALLVSVAALTAHLFVWPDLPPLPDRADAIVELGGPGDRGDAAVELAQQGRAPVVAMSVSEDVVGMHWCRVGQRDGVPVICFLPEPATTQGEARAIAELAHRYGWHSVILVTTPDQAWRATVRVRRCFAGDISVATVTLPWERWPLQIAYQIGATIKAYTIETSC